MKFKRGVDPRYLSSPAWFGLYLADDVHRSLTELDAVCTSTGDAHHNAHRSRHYTGDYGFGYCHAFDLRIWHVNPADYMRRIKRRLGQDYVVLLERDHIHVHWAPVFTELHA